MVDGAVDFIHGTGVILCLDCLGAMLLHVSWELAADSYFVSSLSSETYKVMFTPCICISGTCLKLPITKVKGASFFKKKNSSAALVGVFTRYVGVSPLLWQRDNAQNISFQNYLH